MGGMGSGRWGWHSKATTVEECKVLAASMFREALRHGAPYAGGVKWSRGGTPAGEIGYLLERREGVLAVRLVYSITRGTGEKESFDYAVRLQETYPHLGGVRYWLTCPLVVRGRPCRRRVGKLYLPPGGRYFGCRQCYGLTYESCQESHKWEGFERWMRKMLGGG